MHRPCLTLRLTLIALALATIPRTPSAHASCNLIPSAEKTFVSHVGAVNRPFAAPGESLEIRRRTCENDTPGFLPEGNDHVVTLLFKPENGPARMVVVTDDCESVSTTSCAANPAIDSVACLDKDDALRTITDIDDHDLRLILEFPDTDKEFPPDGDDRTLSGPVTIAVTAKGEPLPCGLATTSCAAHGGLRACIDELYVDDGSCSASIPNGTFSHFTALPSPNDFQEACFDRSPPCAASATEVRGAVDYDGDLLLPMNWQGVLVSDDDTPVPRLVRVRLQSPLPVKIPNQVFLESYTPEGGLLPPILEPQLDPTVAAPNVVTMFGSIDAPYTIIRVARHHGTCEGGQADGERCERDGDCKAGLCETSCVDNPATTCTTNSDCTTGACGTLFDFSPFAETGGPLFSPRFAGSGFCQLSPHASCAGPGDCPAFGDACVRYAMEAQTPVPLEGLAASDTTRTFTIRESIDGVDHNGDGDTKDEVVTLRDRVTGVAEGLGAPQNCDIDGSPDGRAVVRIHAPPFSTPAVAIEGDTVAFLESEPSEHACDLDGDGDLADPILRIYRRGLGETPVARPRAIDGAPRVDGKALAVSGGRVFVRTSERGMAAHVTVRGSLADGGGELAEGVSEYVDFGSTFDLSGDGTEVLFATYDGYAAPGDCDNYESLYVHNLDTMSTQSVTRTYDGAACLDDVRTSDGPWEMTPNGRYVVFETKSPDAFPPGADAGADPFNSDLDVVVYDRCMENGLPVPGCTPSNDRVSVAADGTEPDQPSYQASISGDGRFVTFLSFATNLVDPPISMSTYYPQLFVRDRCLSNGVAVAGCTPGNELLSVNRMGLPVGEGVYEAILSKDASWGFFLSGASGDLVENCYDCANYARDLRNDVTVETPPHSFYLGQAMDGVSDDARYIAFTGDDVFLPDAGAYGDVYVYDRLGGGLSVASISNEGKGGDNYSWVGGYSLLTDTALSGDGRYVFFVSYATNLDESGVPGVGLYLHDVATGITETIHRQADDDPDDYIDETDRVISRDGSTVAWISSSSRMLPPGEDTNLAADVFVRRVDPADPLDVDPLLFPDGKLDDTVLEVVNADTGAISTLCPAGDVEVAAGNAVFLRPESTTGKAGCPAGSLNGDGDTTDEVVHLTLAGGAVQNLGLAAKQIDLSSSTILALASEAGQNKTDLNADADKFDDVVEVRGIGAGSWTNVGQAATRAVIADHTVAFATPEAGQGDGPLNGDGDTDDEVLQIYETQAALLTNTQQQVAAFVLGEPTETACGTLQIVAFQTNEASQGDGSLNNDGDTNESVLQIFEVAGKTLHNTHQAVTPCRLAACDPTYPFRINGATVRFLTLESEQGRDLDGDGYISGVILQSYNACTDTVTVIGRVGDESEDDEIPDTLGGRDPLSDEDGSTVYHVLAARCFDISASCQPGADTCPDGFFCSAYRNLCSPIASGLCRSADDCPTGLSCFQDEVVVAASTDDLDDDGVIDTLDDCLTLPDPLQADADGDGVGDICDVTPEGFCGDGVVPTGDGETCDDGNTTSGDGCSSACALESTCGDANGDGDVKTSDAQLVLRAAVQLPVVCPLAICDVTGDGNLFTGDALAVLRVAVGQVVELKCKAG